MRYVFTLDGAHGLLAWEVFDKMIEFLVHDVDGSKMILSVEFVDSDAKEFTLEELRRGLDLSLPEIEDCGRVTSHRFRDMEV